MENMAEKDPGPIKWAFDLLTFHLLYSHKVSELIHRHKAWCHSSIVSKQAARIFWMGEWVDWPLTSRYLGHQTGGSADVHPGLLQLSINGILSGWVELAKRAAKHWRQRAGGFMRSALTGLWIHRALGYHWFFLYINVYNFGVHCS